MTLRELRAKFGLSVHQATRLCQMPTFPAIKLGDKGVRRMWLINGDKVDEWFAEEAERQKTGKEKFAPEKEPVLVRGAWGDWSKKRRYEDRDKRLRGIS